MKKVAAFLTIACSLLLLHACIMGNGVTGDSGKLIDRQRCRFKLPGDLVLKPIDTSEFDKEGYFEITSHDENETLQIFVFDHKTDVDEQLNMQQKALDTPAVFTAKTITPIKQWGKYNSKGILMNGLYAGGVIKGKITVFAYSTDKRGFLVIQQDVGSHESEKADIKLVADSFFLKQAP